MKCPKCEGKGWVWLQRTEHVSIADICQTCNGTGEVEDKSRSVQRREALQKGEPMPAFDKPEMPERIWAKDFPEAKQPTGKMGGWVEWSDTTQTEYLRADKVREAIKKAIEMDIAQGFWLSTPTTYADYDIRKKDYQLKKKQFANIVISLFPEGLGGEE
jgi:RecJ-like exonuclease